MLTITVTEVPGGLHAVAESRGELLGEAALIPEGAAVTVTGGKLRDVTDTDLLDGLLRAAFDRAGQLGCTAYRLAPEALPAFRSALEGLGYRLDGEEELAAFFSRRRCCGGQAGFRGFSPAPH